MSDDPKLSPAAREAIGAAEEPLLSAATLFEIAIKASLGKLQVADEWAEELLAEGFGLLPVTLAHARAYRELPYATVDGKRLRDPFDRMLIAQADVERCPIVSCDSAIAAHSAPTIW